MPKYRVTYEALLSYSVDVEADDEDDAENIADDEIEQSWDKWTLREFTLCDTELNEPINSNKIYSPRRGQ